MKYVYTCICFISLIHVTSFGESPDWTDYDAILTKYVSRETNSDVSFNWVNYSDLIKDQQFKNVIQALENFPVSKLQTQEEKLSFYINAYNILAINMVLNHWPVTGIKKIGSWIKPVWDKTAGTIGGKEMTLGMIEHKILRPLNEPRIHMAIVCASISCPDLRTEAYRTNKLDKQLDDQTHLFLLNKGKGARIENNQVLISKIFDWFKDDFTKKNGVESFIRNYIDLPEKINIKPGISYNWSLNGG